MTNKSERTLQSTNDFRDELIWGWTPSGDKGWCIIAPIERYSGCRYFQQKRKCCNHRCSDSVYFNELLSVIYLSAIETLICRREMSLIGSTSFGFAQNTILDFQNAVLNS